MQRPRWCKKRPPYCPIDPLTAVGSGLDSARFLRIERQVRSVAVARSDVIERVSCENTNMLNKLDRLLAERSTAVSALGLQGVPPQGYRMRKGGMLVLWESTVPIDWDDDDVSTDDEDDEDEEEEDADDDELLPGEDDDDEEDDDNDLEEDE